VRVVAAHLDARHASERLAGFGARLRAAAIALALVIEG